MFLLQGYGSSAHNVQRMHHYIPKSASKRFSLNKKFRANHEIDLKKSKIEYAVQDCLMWSSLNGFLVGDKESEFFNGSPGIGIMHAPVSLLPAPYSRSSFSVAIRNARLFNEVVSAVAQDSHFLQSTLKRAAETDSFTAGLLHVHSAVENEKSSQGLKLSLYRCDYMEDIYSRNLLHVELNTVAVCGQIWASKVSKLHKFILEKHGKELEKEITPQSLPENPAGESMADALAEAWRQMGDPKASILMVVQSSEPAQYDQHGLTHHLWTNHRVPLVRKTFSEIFSEAQIGPGNSLLLNGTQRISVVYFRAGYCPGDYPSDKEWAARLLLEQSGAAKCPSVAYHLAGAKKVQQELARPGVLERFTQSEESAALLRDCFAGLWALDEESSREAIEEALENPQNFVLKPQREGGGNNVYGEDLRQLVIRLQRDSPSTLGQYILMKRIFPSVNESILVRRGKWKQEKTTSELGIYSVFMRNKEKILFNKEVGHLVRTKSASSNEGGVLSGFGVLNSAHLL